MRSQETVIGGLLPETTYSVTVAAYTTKGDGARSKPKVITTTGAGERGERRRSLTGVVVEPLKRCPGSTGEAPVQEEARGLEMSQRYMLL